MMSMQLYYDRALNKMDDAKTARSKVVEKPEWEGHPMWVEYNENWKKKETDFYAKAEQKQVRTW